MASQLFLIWLRVSFSLSPPEFANSNHRVFLV